MFDDTTSDRRDRRLVFLDTETTGLGAEHVPWEIAMIIRDPVGNPYEPEMPDREVEIVLDVDQTQADPYALRLAGFWNRHPRYARLDPSPLPLEGNDVPAPMPAEDAARRVALVTHEAIIVGVNPSFDMGVLERFLRQHGRVPTWDYHPYPVEAVAVGRLLSGADALTWPGRPWNTYQLSEACGVEPPSEADRHTAMGDARWARDWFDVLHGVTRTVADERPDGVAHQPGQ